MRPQLATVAVIAITAAPSAVGAQIPQPLSAVAAHDVYGVAWVDGALRAGSPAYVARFDPGVVEITPALGRRAPREFPLRVAMRSVHRGGHELWRASDAGRPAPQLRGASVHYEHGRGLVERYDVRAEGLEQSFVFAERPAGEGDLVVRCTLATDLECAPTTSARELRFVAADLGGITIGAVTGVDAHGRTAAGHMAFDGVDLQLVLPHAFVESASYPLVLDPLFGPQLNSGVSFDDHFPDSAYDAASGIWGIVFEFPISATSSDVWIMRQDGASGAMLGGTSVGSGPGSQRRPGIASVNRCDRFLVVWQDDGVGNGDVKCRGVRPSDGMLTNTVTVAGTAAAELAPDVGGDAFGNLDLEALVVWQEVGVGILGVQVTLPIGLGDPVVVGSPVTLDPSPQSQNPAISKSGGFDPANGGRYVVAWETSLGGASLIGYLGVDRDLGILTSPFYAGSGFPVANPDVDGDGTQFLIVFESLEGPTATTSDVWCQPAAICAGGTTLCGPPGGPLVNVAGDDERQPAVASLGPTFVAAWAKSEPGSTTDYRIGISNVVPGACQLCNATTLTGANPGFRCSYPALCAMRSNGVESTEALLTWEQRENSTGNSLLRSHRYRPFTGGSVTPLGGVGGCGGGGIAGVDGPFAVGNLSFDLTLRNADPLAPAAVVLFDTAMGPTTACGTCTFLSPQVVSPLFPVTNGDADAPLPLPCNAGLLGFAMDVQWAVLTPVTPGAPCPLLPFLSVSDALRMVLSN